MGGSTSGGESDDIDWNSDDDREVENGHVSVHSRLTASASESAAWIIGDDIQVQNGHVSVQPRLTSPNRNSVAWNPDDNFEVENGHMSSLPRFTVPGSESVAVSNTWAEGGSASGGESDNIDWNSDDDREVENGHVAVESRLTAPGSESVAWIANNNLEVHNGHVFVQPRLTASSRESVPCNSGNDREVQNSRASSLSRFPVPSREPVAVSNNWAEASSSAPKSNIFKHFVASGFSDKLVSKAIEENGEENSDAILESILTYTALGESPEESKPPVGVDVDSDSDLCLSDYDESFLDDLSDDSWSALENGETDSPSTEEKTKLMFLTDMGYSIDEAAIAIERCGVDTPLDELANFICAAQMMKAEDVNYTDEKPKINLYGLSKKRKMICELMKKKKNRGLIGEEEEFIQLPKPMIGFGVPNGSDHILHRTLPESAKGPPYFYYENVALAPKGVWNTISRFLYDIQPEFVDSKFFCAAARKRGYVHNLPIKNRYPLFPLQPYTIEEALPMTKRWWPAWDTRTKLNCLQTVHASAQLTSRIRKELEKTTQGEPSLNVQKYVMNECRKWNLVWVGKNKVAPLEPDEIEVLLGFSKNHTRGGGISRTDRFKSLGNSFQVDTVAYHLSVLKDMFPEGLNLLSLFSGIGGAEVALYRLGIKLNLVVSVEKSAVNQDIVRSWWEEKNQKGTLIHLDDVQALTGEKLEYFINVYGRFDLIVGGSPCNNLAGSNRVSRNGLEGTESSLFYDYFRILDLVKTIMGNNTR